MTIDWMAKNEEHGEEETRLLLKTRFSVFESWLLSTHHTLHPAPCTQHPALTGFWQDVVIC